VTTDPDDLAEVIDAFGEGAFRELAERAGRIAIKKMEAMSLAPEAVDALDGELQRQILRASFIDAAAEMLPAAARADVEAQVDTMLALLEMEGGSNADGGNTRQ
jgi:hypothetical protein